MGLQQFQSTSLTSENLFIPQLTWSGHDESGAVGFWGDWTVCYMNSEGRGFMFYFHLLRGTDPRELALNSLLISDIYPIHILNIWNLTDSKWDFLVILSFWNTLSFLPQGAAPGLCLQTNICQCKVRVRIILVISWFYSYRGAEHIKGSHSADASK